MSPKTISLPKNLKCGDMATLWWAKPVDLEGGAGCEGVKVWYGTYHTTVTCKVRVPSSRQGGVRMLCALVC